eukprot:1488702-Pyramimonas_sp.AAC.1
MGKDGWQERLETINFPMAPEDDAMTPFGGAHRTCPTPFVGAPRRKLLHPWGHRRYDVVRVLTILANPHRQSNVKNAQYKQQC